ncbi:hypothetical protein GCM10009116_25790 [Brevundimonas basaltis]
MDLIYRAVQRARLDRLAKGEIEPICPREEYFLWTLEAMDRVDPDDFVVSGLLFLAEKEERAIQAEQAAAAAEPPALPAP